MNYFNICALIVFSKMLVILEPQLRDFRIFAKVYLLLFFFESTKFKVSCIKFKAIKTLL